MMTFARGKERKHGRRVGKAGEGSGSRYNFKQDDQGRPQWEVVFEERPEENGMSNLVTCREHLG